MSRFFSNRYCRSFVLSIIRSSTKRMAMGRPATAPPMPSLKCGGVQSNRRIRVSGTMWEGSFAQHPPRVLLVQPVGDAPIRRADQFGKRRMRTAGSARQRR